MDNRPNNSEQKQLEIVEEVDQRPKRTEVPTKQPQVDAVQAFVEAEGGKKNS